MPTLSTPLSIVMGAFIFGGMVGAGVYFGLRGSQAQAPTTATAPPPTAPASTAAPAPTISLPAATATPSGAPKELVVAQVKAALEPYKAVVAKDCWRAEGEKTSRFTTARWTFNFTFAADGSQITRGISDDPEHPASAVLTACVLKAIPPLKIAAPGATVYVDVPFSAP